MLLCMPSSGINKNTKRNNINKAADKYSITEDYIRGLSGNSPPEQRFRSVPSNSPPSNNISRLKLNLPLLDDDLPIMQPKIASSSSSSYANNSLNNSSSMMKQDFMSRTSNDVRKSVSQQHISSILPNRRDKPFSHSASSKFSNITPPKSVKFEQTTLNRDFMNDDEMSYREEDTYHHRSASYPEMPISLGLDVYGRAYPSVDKEEFDIDEKVKEGKAILERLLKSTESSKNSEEEKISERSKKFFSEQHETSDVEDEDERSFNNRSKSPLSSSWNETEEIIALGTDFTFDVDSDAWIKIDKENKDSSSLSTKIYADEKRSPFMKNIKERQRQQSFLMSTRLELNDSRTPMMSQSEGSLLETTNKVYGVRDKKNQINVSDEKLTEEIKVLKEELSNHQVNSFLETKSIKEDNEKLVGKLYSQISTLTKQKDTLDDYITQLKGSLQKKNDKCFELQEHLHKKLTLIHQLTTNDDRDRHHLENEVNILNVKKKNLEEQVTKMETSLKIQYEEIRELEKRFQREKNNNMNMLKNKEEEIVALQQQLEFMAEDHKRQHKETAVEHQLEIENVIMKGKANVQPEIEEMKLKLELEIERNSRLQKKHQSDVNHLKSNFDTVRATNSKLKQDLETSRQQNHEQEKSTLSNMKNARDEAELENDMLKKKLIDYERIQKTMALELIEESTKLAVICGSPASTRVSSPDNYVDCNIMSEALVVFKEHLENFRHYALSLRNENNQSKSECNEENSGSGQTSAKLLRHLQNRVQQLRKENEMLHANSSLCENCNGDIKSNVSDESLSQSISEKNKLDIENKENKINLNIDKNKSTDDKVILSSEETVDKLNIPQPGPLSVSENNNEVADVAVDL